MRSTKPFNAEIGTALLGFNQEAVVYRQAISGADAHRYAMDYARILRNRAWGLEVKRSRSSVRVVQQDRNVIKTTLDKMYRKYFATHRVTSQSP